MAPLPGSLGDDGSKACETGASRRGRPECPRALCAVAALLGSACGAAADHAAVSAAQAAEIDAIGDVVVDVAADKTLKIDFLWVMEHGAGLAQRRRDLAVRMASFVAELQTAGPVDLRMAAVTPQQVADVGSQGNNKKVGQFNRETATAYPPNAIKYTRQPCVSDAQCVTATAYDYVFAAGQALGSTSSLCPQPPAASAAYTGSYVGQKTGKD